MKATLEKLKSEYHGLFCDRPFSIGIAQQLMTLHPDIPKQLIRAALGFYCKSRPYIKAMTYQPLRLNLDLSDGARVTDAEQGV